MPQSIKNATATAALAVLFGILVASRSLPLNQERQLAVTSRTSSGRACRANCID